MAGMFWKTGPDPKAQTTYTECSDSSQLVLRHAGFAVQLDSVPPPAFGAIHSLIRAGHERFDLVDSLR